ncbi:glycosyltransferase family 39 protein [Trichlorobacter lovleyi]|uniref:glycosyltransferase family 39 protein n=1 Tax=Trichlorobacter lovleyi TaxID=313985 RepID=UPI0024801E58|nr:glycosyltransferase family 39 protein [Trichlorobacter lovleyi]
MKMIKSYLLKRNYPVWGDLLVVGSVFGSAFFFMLGRIGLIEPDEGRYAEIPREMLEQCDFITPTLNYVAYFEKPPLHYWLTALSLKTIGMNEFAARLPGALAGLMTVLLVYVTVRAIWGRSEAISSAIVLGASTGFVVQSRINLTDMTLTFCLTAALCSFMIASYKWQHKKLYYYLFYLFCGLAVLTKGLIGVLFPVCIILLYLLFNRSWHLLREMHLPDGILLLVVVTSPWFILVSQQHPDFAKFFFVHEHFERFLTTTHGRYQPFWFFFPIFLLTMLPWSFYAFRALLSGLQTRFQEETDPRFFLFIWVTFVFIFFSISHSKLIPYILPIFPPVAMLIGIMFVRLVKGETVTSLKAENLSLMAVLTVGAAGCVIYSWLPALAPVLVRQGWVSADNRLVTKIAILTPTAGGILGLIFIGMAMAVFWAARKQSVVLLGLGLFCGSYLLEVVGQQFVLERIALKKSSRELGQKAGQLLKKDGVLASFGYEQSLPFYTGRRVVVVGSKGELEFGSKRGDQSDWFIDEERFVKLWQGERQIIALLKQDELKRIEGSLYPAATVLGQKFKKLLITNKRLASSERITKN